MNRAKVRFPEGVAKCLELVGRNGETNMQDVPCVIELLLKMGFIDSAFWVYDNRSRYAKGISDGFAIEKEGDTGCADSAG